MFLVCTIPCTIRKLIQCNKWFYLKIHNILIFFHYLNVFPNTELVPYGNSSHIFFWAHAHVPLPISTSPDKQALLWFLTYPSTDFIHRSKDSCTLKYQYLQVCIDVAINECWLQCLRFPWTSQNQNERERDQMPRIGCCGGPASTMWYREDLCLLHQIRQGFYSLKHDWFTQIFRL